MAQPFSELSTSEARQVSKSHIDLNIKPTYLQRHPIHRLDPQDSKDAAGHCRVVETVKQMRVLNQYLPRAKNGHEKLVIGRQIAATDKQFDQLAYELYGLTEEESRIVKAEQR